MRIARFQLGSLVGYGLVEGDSLVEIRGDICGEFTPTGTRHSLQSVKLLPPLIPSKLVAIGRNYAEHAAEFNNPAPEDPIVFLKSTTSIIGPGDAIKVVNLDHRTDFEAELVVVMKRQCFSVDEKDALDYVLGYTCGNDVSDRVLQRKDGQWVRAKSFNTYGPLGPWIETELDPSDQKIECLQNGEVKQSSRTRHLLFSVPYLISFVSRIMPLLPGDMIMTGTPSGVSPVKPGDTVEVRIEGIGSLINPVGAAGGR